MPVPRRSSETALLNLRSGGNDQLYRDLFEQNQELSRPLGRRALYGRTNVETKNTTETEGGVVRFACLAVGAGVCEPEEFWNLGDGIGVLFQFRASLTDF